MLHQGMCATPIGPVVVTWGPPGVREIVRPGDARPVPGDPLPGEVAEAIEHQIATGEPTGVEIDLSARSELEQAVLFAMAEIPYGEVRPYSWLAARAGRLRAVRAVASAVGRNPVPLLLPCHRVVRADGAVGEFGWGVDVKLALLHHEGAPVVGDRWHRRVSPLPRVLPVEVPPAALATLPGHDRHQ